MGWGSYQEDNLDAKGEPVRSSLHQQKKKKEVSVKAEKPKDVFESKSPIRNAVERILVQSAGPSYLTLPEWVEQVRLHLKKDSRESIRMYEESIEQASHASKVKLDDLKTVVAKALISLNHERHARQISLDHSPGKWRVFREQYNI